MGLAPYTLQRYTASVLPLEHWHVHDALRQQPAARVTVRTHSSGTHSPSAFGTGADSKETFVFAHDSCQNSSCTRCVGYKAKAGGANEGGGEKEKQKKHGRGNDNRQEDGKQIGGCQGTFFDHQLLDP